MRLHFLQHVPFEGPGCIRAWAEAAGWEITGSHLYRDHRLPAIDGFDWLVIMGGPMNIYEEVQYPWLAREKEFIDRAIAGHKVVLGICLGAQLIAAVLGARVSRSRHEEIGWFPIQRTAAPTQPTQAAAIEDGLDVLHWHADTFDLPDRAVHLARSAACENQAFIYNDRVVGLQFHLEMTAEGLQDLVQHSGQPITAGRFVQPPATMLAQAERFHRANQVMNRLLDGLAGMGRG